MTKTPSPYDSLRRSLPHSAMVFPDSLFDRIKYIFWRFYTPFHPFVRDMSIKLHIVSLKYKEEQFGARQDYLIGTIAETETIESVVHYLIEKGYGNHFVAWEDAGEVVSLRYSENFSTQYHIRIFEDGEVRGHFELTTEHSPFKHYYAVGMEDRREHFVMLLGEKITPATS
jgi:hypothetical protein